jgi:putative DNA primase/helicase
VLDIDRKGGKDGLTVIRHLEAIHGALPDTYKVSTPSGGEHWFYAYPPEFTIQSKANLFKEHGEGLDIRADGGYVVAAPSQTDSSADATGKTYTGHYTVSHRVPVAALPDAWLKVLIPRERVPVPRAQPLAVNDQLSEVQDALLHIPNDDYDLWVSIGKACYSLGNAGFMLWDTWSRSSHKYNQAEMPSKWQSFSAGAPYQAAFIFDTAARYGWANPKKGSRANVAPIKPHIQIKEPSDWLAPEPLTESSLSAPYPMDVLPDLIQKAIHEVVDVVKCPPALAACSALSVMAVAGQGVANIQPHKGLKPSPLSLFILSVGESGERKTTADKHFSPILTQWENHQAEQLRPALAKYRAELKAWQRQKIGTEKAIEKSTEKGDTQTILTLTSRLVELEQSEPEKVLAPLLVLEDTTAQATAYDLTHQWPSAGILSDEAGVVFGGHSMKADNITHNLATLNKLWDGSSQKINRRGEGGTFKVEHCRLSLGLAIQPSVIRAFYEESGVVARGSGFFARFLLAHPNSTQGTRFLTLEEAETARYQHHTHLNLFYARLDQLLEQSYEHGKGGALDQLPTLELTPAARTVWVKYLNDVEYELRSGGDMQDCKDIASKSADNAARIAGLFHLFNGGDVLDDVTEDTMQAACVLAGWHLYEARRFFGEVALPEEQNNAVMLDQWLIDYCEKQGTDHIGKTTAMQRVPSKLRFKAVLESALNSLEHAHRIRRVIEARTEYIEINPALLGR